MFKNCVLKPDVNTIKWAKSAGIRAVKTMAHWRSRGYGRSKLAVCRVCSIAGRGAVTADQCSRHPRGGRDGE